MVKFKMLMIFLNEFINPHCDNLFATFFEFILETCQKRASSCLRTAVRPKRTLSQLFELLFPHPFLMPLKKNCQRKRRGESGGMSRGTNWRRRCLRDGGWYKNRREGRGRWCCWWRRRGWSLWVRVWGFLDLRKFSSKETCKEECVWGCCWHTSPFIMWVFKSSAFTNNLSFRILLLASHWVLLG